MYPNIFTQCEDILGLNLPVTVRLKCTIKGAMGKYWTLVNSKGKPVSHLIHISLARGDIRTLNELVIHEYIHAWQAENNKKDNHGKSFKKMARNPKWLVQGLVISENNNIYIPGCDKK